MQQLIIEDGILLPENAVSFEEFIAWYPEDGKRYELHLGVIKEMPLAKGTHQDIGGFLSAELNFQIRRQNLPFSIPLLCLIKSKLIESVESGFMPDVVVLDRRELVNETLWQKSSVIQRGPSIPLVIEVVSNNWRTDYGTKLAAYEDLGIQEYWIVDYLALGAVRYLGKPKQPTVTICQLIDGEYELFPFIAGQILQSQVLPSLELNVDDIFGINNEASEMS
ncbi:MAG: Uma2 family endonuclease [Microcystaceae cyanobacterium]